MQLTDVRTSLGLTLPGVDHGRASPSVDLVLYAATPGSFVDLTADLTWLTGRPTSDFALDRHLSVPGGSDTRITLRAASVINQAIGFLIGSGYTLANARRELGIQADAAGTDRHIAARVILDKLMADAKRADPESDTG